MGVGCLAGVLIPSAIEHRGCCGIDANAVLPLCAICLLTARPLTCCARKNGLWETYFLNLMALRAAALSGYRVIMTMPLNAADGTRGWGWCTRQLADLDTPINIPDIVFDDEL